MSLCLSMIVRNESARIRRCLASLEPYVTSYVIADTGSTDDTPHIIRQFFDERGIDGELIDLPFVNFGETRNAALEAAKASRFDFDHILLADADMELVANGHFHEALNGAPAYRILQRSNDLAYFNTRIVRRDAKAVYRGVTHEYLDVEGPEPTNLPENVAWFRDHADGANRPGKFERDIALLKGAVDKDPTDGRSWFYLAQSYRDAGKLPEAVQAYAKRSEMGGWAEEAWRAKLEQARASLALGDEGAFAVAALAAYDMRPIRAEPLYDLARNARLADKPRVGAMFAKRGLSIPQPDDILFVEPSVYDYGLREEFAISAFYDAGLRAEGRDVCDGLALDRSIPAPNRELARKNLWFYARPLIELATSFAPQRINWTPPEGWRAMNPSVARIGDKLMCVIRTVNYTISSEGHYLMPEGETAIRARNWLAELNIDLKVNSATEILPPENWPSPPAYGEVIGWEDMRLFDCNGLPCVSATVRELYADGMCRQVFASIDGERLTNWRVMSPEGRHEKNWAPIADNRASYLYLSDPTRVVHTNRDILADSTPSIAAENFRGGSQLIPLDGGWLGLIHEVPHFHRYSHRFIWLDADFRLAKVSTQFRFLGTHGIEFAAGMAWLDDERLVISFGVADAEAWLATVSTENVRGILRTMDQPKRTLADLDRLDDFLAENGILDKADSVAATRIATLEPYRPSKARFLSVAGQWADGETNRTLRTRGAVDEALALLNGLPLHPDGAKNWDTAVGLVHALRHTKRDSAILDAGAGRESNFLPALACFGYRHLTGVNLLFNQVETANGVTYAPGDITALCYESATFDFIFCQSVIEHDVDTGRFFAEASRLLKPKGHLFVSTDYWPVPLPTSWNPVFDWDGATRLISEAKAVGLRITGRPDLFCDERVVTHGPGSYTFLNLLFRKP